MATYVYESRRGKLVEMDFPMGSAPSEVHIGRTVYRKIIFGVAVSIPKEHRASTYAGREGDKVLARHHRCNKEAAQGLANGTMRAPDDRDVCGDKQTRESKAQFNDYYQKAKETPKRGKNKT